MQTVAPFLGQRVDFMWQDTKARAGMLTVFLNQYILYFSCPLPPFPWRLAMYPVHPHDVLLSTLLRVTASPIVQMAMKNTAESEYQFSCLLIIVVTVHVLYTHNCFWSLRRKRHSRSRSPSAERRRSKSKERKKGKDRRRSRSREKKRSRSKERRSRSHEKHGGRHRGHKSPQWVLHLHITYCNAKFARANVLIWLPSPAHKPV